MKNFRKTAVQLGRKLANFCIIVLIHSVSKINPMETATMEQFIASLLIAIALEIVKIFFTWLKKQLGL